MEESQERTASFSTFLEFAFGRLRPFSLLLSLQPSVVTYHQFLHLGEKRFSGSKFGTLSTALFLANWIHSYPPLL